MSALEAKITISAVDRVSSVVKGIQKSLEGITNASGNLGNAWNRLSLASSNFVSQVRNVSLIAIAAGTSIFALTEHYASYAKELTLASQRTGVAIQDLQGLQYAARMSGVGTDSLNTSLKFLNRSIVVGASNPTSQQAQAFASMGINLHNANGSLKTANELLPEISKRFAGSTDAARKTATAMILFGRSGTDLIPFLDEGPEKIIKLESELRKLGHVWSPQEVTKGLDFEESFLKLKTAISGVASVIAINLFPVLKPIIDTMTAWVVANKQWIADNIKQDVIVFGEGLKKVWEMLKNIKAVVWPVIDALGGFKTIVAVLVGSYLLRLASSMLEVGIAFGKFSWALLASPFTWYIAGIVLIGVAVYELIAHWKEFKAYMVKLWPSIQPYFEAFANFITLGMYSLVKKIYQNWDSIKAYLESAWKWLSNKASYYFDLITNFIINAFAPIMPYVKYVWTGVKTFLTSILNDILGLFGTNLDAVESKISSVFGSMKKAVISFVDFITAPFKTLYHFLELVVDKAVSVKNALMGTSSTVPSIPDGSNATKSVSPLVKNNLGLDKLDTIQAGARASLDKLTSVDANSKAGIFSQLGSTASAAIDIHMLIDYEGRPTKVTAKSPSPINFTASTGKMV